MSSCLFCQGRDEGIATHRWLLVNLMNREVFNSLILNRDIWPNPAVRELIQESFILLQVFPSSMYEIKC